LVTRWYFVPFIDFHHATYGSKIDAAAEILSGILFLSQIVRAKKAVVSNASMWDTLDLLPQDAVPKSYQDKVKATPQCDSFMHLHLGFDAEVGCHMLCPNKISL
jgi:hypothetical protein